MMPFATPALSVPLEVREVAEFALDDADTFSRNLLQAERQGFTMFEKQMMAACGGTLAVGNKMITLAGQNIEASLDFGHQLVRAQDYGEVLKLQLDFAARQAAALARQWQELGQTVAKAVGALTKS
jgi:hypothetical protein